MSSSLPLQQCPAYLVRRTLMVLEMGGRCPYNCCFVGCCFQDFFIIAHGILEQQPSSFFSIRLVNVHVVHPYSNMDTTATWKKLCFILSERSNLHMTEILWIAVNAFDSRVLMSTSFRKPPFNTEMPSFRFWLKQQYSVLSALTWRTMPPTAFSRLWSKDSDVFAWSAMSSA